ncbi:MAG: serine hydrolase [Salinivirgaceae bacterium]|nr:serine hydrolase [Salinivirgaceae bacterium]MDD4746882.1 serine hydrolase [Salinivirgaceae bacterium]
MKIKNILIPTKLIFFSLFVALFLTGCDYFWKALIYQKAEILDYTLFHNRVVKHGTPEPWKLHEKYNSYTQPTNFKSYHDSLETVGYLVIKDYQILFEEYAPTWTDTTISNSFSMAKSIVSMLIGISIDKGFIGSENDLVLKYIPEFDNEQNRRLKIQHLLNMASGLNWDESYGNPWSTTTKAYYGTELEKQILSLKVVETLGEKFSYKSGDTQLLSLIIRNASGISTSKFMETYLWSKIGAETDLLWSLDRENGIEKAYCCINSNVRDFARIGQLVLNRGKWNSETILSEQYIDKMLTPATHLMDEFGKQTNYYGYQWWNITIDNLKINYMRGINGQYVFVIPEKNVVIVRLGHRRSKERIDNIPADIYKWVENGLEIVSKVEN